MSEIAESTTSNQLTLFAEASLASLTVWPGSEEARKTTVTSGLNFYVLFRNSDPLGFLRRMFQASYHCISTLCYLTWKVKATPVGRSIFQLALSVPRTDGIASLLLPTPTTVDTGSYFNQSKSPGAKKRPTLGAMAKHGLWPTPTGKTAPNTTDPADIVNAQGQPLQPGQKPHDKRTGKPVTTALTDMVRLWPTPTSRDWHSGKASEATHERNSRPLSEVVVKAEMWPTPRANSAMAAMITEEANPDRYPNLETRLKKRDPSVVGGQLNPTWVEWLMGFPIGWTNLEASVMP